MPLHTDVTVAIRKDDINGLQALPRGVSLDESDAGSNFKQVVFVEKPNLHLADSQ
jgi:hypothetical protein